MSTHRIVSVRRVGEAPDGVLNLVAAADEPGYMDDDRQSELRIVFEEARKANPSVYPQVRAQRGDAGASWLTGEFLVHVAALTSPVVAAIGVWIAAKAGRRIRIKIGDIEAEAATMEQIEQLLARAREMKREQDLSKP